MRFFTKESYQNTFRKEIRTGDLISIKYAPTSNLIGLLTSIFLPKDSPSHTGIAYVETHLDTVMVAEQVGCGNGMTRLSQYVEKLGKGVVWVDVLHAPVDISRSDILEALRTKTRYSILQFISAGLERMTNGLISLPLPTIHLICSMFAYKLFKNKGWTPPHPLKVVDPREIMDAVRYTK